jgi:hypothetical protein
LGLLFFLLRLRQRRPASLAIKQALIIDIPAISTVTHKPSLIKHHSSIVRKFLLIELKKFIVYFPFCPKPIDI